jgi:3'(2'), 5'-bisphosphate nucleotidase
MLEVVRDLCRAAGVEILRIYGTDAEVRYKEDRSPLTAADTASHEYLVTELARLIPGVPVVSEESGDATADPALMADTYWLIDPLDGTKEFIKRTGDFTVNVALIRGGRPVLGVVHVPVRNTDYFAELGAGAWRQTADRPAVAIRTKAVPPARVRVVASKDHAGHELETVLGQLPDAELKQIGSSLKFCLVAEGSADCYPRLAPTMEWDTAAAHCVVETAGGVVLTLDGKPLAYGKPGRKNPSFIVVSDEDGARRFWLPLLSGASAGYGAPVQPQ